MKEIKEDRQTLRETDRDWQEAEDGHYRRKNVGRGWVAELMYGTERGGQILLWEKVELGDKDDVGSLAWEIDKEDSLGYFSQEHSVARQEEQLYELFNEVCFMDWRNASSEYKGLKNISDIIHLARRNL